MSNRYSASAILRNDPSLITLCSGMGSAPSSRLARARINAGYTTAIEFARQHGIPQATYALHESGGRGIRPDVAEKYAGLLGNCTAEWILYGKGRGPGDADVDSLDAPLQLSGEPEKLAAFMLLHDRFTALAEQYEEAMGKDFAVLPRLLGYRNDPRGRIKAIFSLWEQIVNADDDLSLLQRVQNRLVLLERGIAEFLKLRTQTLKLPENKPAP